MVRTQAKLTALKVQRTNKPGVHSDGGGLYLRINTKGHKNWVFRFMLNGRARWMGLGPLHTISLAEARVRAAECRQRRHDGVDPIDDRRSKQQKAMLESGRAITFKECAVSYIASHKVSWHNAKHAAQWEATLATYAEPVIGVLSVQAIDTPEVMKVLEPIWAIKSETASRLRGRIEAILDWAKVRGYRTGENPARWRGHLENLLPAVSKMRRVQHHAALPYGEQSAFMNELKACPGSAARALEFAILTTARTGEVLGARWNEINVAEKVWIIPARRMKAGKEHRVPLSPRALEIIEKVKPAQHDNGDMSEHLVFAGGKHSKPLSNMAFLMLLRRMGRSDITAHGFRSTFRDWAAERTNFPNEVAEMALAHAVGDKTEAAYRRGDLFNKRRRLMDEWAKYCSFVHPSEQTNVAPFRAKG